MLADLSANWPMFVSVIVVIAAIILYARDTFPMELVSAGIITTLLLLFFVADLVPSTSQSVSPETLLSGFGNPALITIMALLVVGQGLFQTGALDGPSRFMMSSYDSRPLLTLIAAFAAVFVTSAFINNTPVVVMFLPIMAAFAEKMKVSPSKLMQPLSFVSVFAGMTTLIGTSTNLLAADIYKTTEGVSLGFFELAPVGLILAAAGALYMVPAFFLPNREGMEANLVSRSGRQFVAQIAISEGNPLVGQTAIAGMFPDLAEMTVRMIQRGESSFLPPFDDVTLKAGDLLIVAATRKTLTDTLA